VFLKAPRPQVDSEKVNGSWLIRDGLDRERMLDMDRRLAPLRRQAFAVLALALVASGPWVGWWTLLPLVGAALLFALADRYVPRMDRPEYAMFVAWAGSELIIAASVALTGGPHVALSWLAIPVVTLVARFSVRGIVNGVAFALVVLLAVALGTDTAAVLDDPTLVIAPAALIVSLAMLSTALMRSDLDFRNRAVIDPLTGMLNRGALRSRVEELGQQSALSGEPVGLIVVDVDDFKLVNDEHGHVAGDAVLRDLAYRLRRELRAFDLAYRLGGEEFLMVLPGAGLEATAALAKQLCGAVDGEVVGGVEITISCGVAASRRGTRFEYDPVFGAADAALYEAKHSGRNCVRSAGEAEGEPAPCGDRALTTVSAP
jgi:diguanylate cyclase (GGDEF)-like protein